MSSERESEGFSRILRTPAAFLPQWRRVGGGFVRGLEFPRRPLGRNVWLFIWLVVALAAAQITLYVHPTVGVYVNAAALCSLLGLALWQARARQLIIAVGIVPVAMLFGLSLPDVSVFQRSVTVSVLVLLLSLVYQYLFTLDFPVEGTKVRTMVTFGYALAVPLMIVLGQLLGIVAFALLRGNYEFHGTPLSVVVVGLIVMAISEEVLFRGLIEQRGMIIFHPLMAALLSATLYALVTLGHGTGPGFVLMGALIGVTTSLVYYKKQNLVLTIIVNAAAKVMYVGLMSVFAIR